VPHQVTICAATPSPSFRPRALAVSRCPPAPPPLPRKYTRLRGPISPQRLPSRTVIHVEYAVPRARTENGLPVFAQGRGIPSAWVVLAARVPVSRLVLCRSGRAASVERCAACADAHARARQQIRVDMVTHGRHCRLVAAQYAHLSRVLASPLPAALLRCGGPRLQIPKYDVPDTAS